MHKEALTKEGAQLFPLLPAFDHFYLAGGTALALQIGHRVSVDFDLFSSEPIPRTLLSKVKETFPGPIAPTVNNRDELTVLVGNVKITFLSYPFPVIDPLIRSGKLPFLSVKEIGATKAYSIGRRGTYKDYVDLYFIITEGHATLAELIAMTDLKYGGVFNSRLFSEQLLFMDDIEDYSIDFLVTPVTPVLILQRFQEEVGKLAFA